MRDVEYAGYQNIDLASMQTDGAPQHFVRGLFILWIDKIEGMV